MVLIDDACQEPERLRNTVHFKEYDLRAPIHRLVYLPGWLLSSSLLKRRMRLEYMLSGRSHDNGFDGAVLYGTYLNRRLYATKAILGGQDSIGKLQDITHLHEFSWIALNDKSSVVMREAVSAYWKN